MKPFLALVVWKDAHQVFPHWGTLDELDEKPYVVESGGWLLPDAKPGHVVLAQSIGQGHYDSGIAIPLEMVKSIHRLKKDGKV